MLKYSVRLSKTNWPTYEPVHTWSIARSSGLEIDYITLHYITLHYPVVLTKGITMKTKKKNWPIRTNYLFRILNYCLLVSADFIEHDIDETKPMCISVLINPFSN